MFELDPTPGNARLFHDRIAGLKRNNPHSSAVDVHDPDDYLHDRLFLTEDGRAGFAIAEDDELVSVFSYNGEHAGDAMVEKAVECGARRLDCYDIGNGLPRFYSRHGFTPVARVKWADDYAADDWPYDRLGRPDVISMAITDNPPHTTPYVDYDTAVDMAKRAARG